MIFVVDARGDDGADQALAKVLRVTARPILLAVNKVDAEGQEGGAAEFSSSAFGPAGVSNRDGHRAAPGSIRGPPGEARNGASIRAAGIRLAIVGRPNVGKSLFQSADRRRARRGEQRSERPGTRSTRNSRTSVAATGSWTRRGCAARPGRRQSVEIQSVERAFGTIRSADIVLVVLDALRPPAHRIWRSSVVRPPAPAPDRPAQQDGQDPLRQPKRLSAGQLRSCISAWRFRPAGIGPERERRGKGARDAGSAGGGVRPQDPDTAAELCARRNRAATFAVLQGQGPAPLLHRFDRVFPPSFVVFTNGAGIETAYNRFLVRQLRSQDSCWPAASEIPAPS